MPAIEVHGLRKTFAGRKAKVHALRGIDLEVSDGQVVGLLGPNGAGKTTCVNILATLLDPDGGTASVLGHDVVRDADAVRGLVGLSGQFAAIDENLTGRENLWMFGRLYRLSSRAAKRRAAELLAAFDLTDAADRVTKNYSGGMRRRLDLAGSLVAQPPVLFLDEPTTGLDPKSRLGLWDIIRDRVRQGATILLTTQYLEEADALADRIVVVDHGEVIARGTADELKAQVGGERIEVVVRSGTDVAGAVASLVDALGIDRADATVDTRRVVVPAHGGARRLVDVVRALDAVGVEIDDIAFRRPTLDDVFLTLTGHGADDTAAPGPGSARELAGRTS